MKKRIPLRVFTDSRPLLELIGSTKQIEEKQLRQSVANLKQLLEEKDVEQYSWIEGTEIVADALTKEGSKRKELDEIIGENKFEHAQTKDNLVTYENEEIKITNLMKKRDFH